MSCKLNECFYSIVLITESWLNASIPDCFLSFCGRYQVFRKDRINSQGGGVMALVDTNLSACNVVLPDKYSSLELLCFDVFMSSLTVRFIVCYRPPNYDSDASNYLSLLLPCIEQLAAHKNPTILTGDFNLPRFNWPNMFASSDHFHQSFLDLTVQNGFVQYVREPTRCENILDLVLCNDVFLISDCTVCPPIIGCDHSSVNFTVHCKSAIEPEPPTAIIRDFKNADFDGLNAFFNNIDWNNVLTTTDNIDVMWNNFIAVATCGIELYVPERTIRSSKCKHFKQYPLYIRRLLSKKCSAWRLYRRFHTEGTRARYMQCDKQCKAAIDRFVSKKENELITGGRIGDFYKYVNNKIVSKSGVGILKNDTGETVIEDADKAELLNKFFSSVFTVDNNIIPLLPTTVDLPKTLGEVNFSFDKVLKVLRGLKAKHTVGPDGLTTFFL